MTPKRALIVLSDQGFHWDELTDVYHAFDDAHFQVDLASPMGHPKAEPLTLRPNWILHLLGRGTTRSRLPRTPWWGRPVVEAIMRARRLDAVEPPSYDAVYVAGGLGDLEDVESNSLLSRLLERAHEAGAWIAGRVRVLATYPELLGQDGEKQRLLLAKSPRAARRQAWHLVEAVTEGEDLHGYRHLREAALKIPEFLDKKSGRTR